MLDADAVDVDFNKADVATRAALQLLLRTDITELAFAQAALPVAVGGLGLRPVGEYRDAMHSDAEAAWGA